MDLRIETRHLMKPCEQQNDESKEYKLRGKGMDTYRIYVKLFHYVCVVRKLNSEYKATKFQSPTLRQTEAEARAEKHQSTRAEENETKLYTAV